MSAHREDDILAQAICIKISDNPWRDKSEKESFPQNLGQDRKVGQITISCLSHLLKSWIFDTIVIEL